MKDSIEKFLPESKKTRYWIFVAIFILFLCVGYYFAFRIEDSLRSDLLSVLNQGSMLIFVISGGYFAYSQLIEYKVEKYKNRAHDEFKRKKYARASEYYKEAISLDPHDFATRAEYLENLISAGDFPTFDENIRALEKFVIDGREELIFHYLKTARHLLEENPGYAKSYIKKSIDLYKDNPGIFSLGNWDYSDIRQAETYEQLEGEIKTIFDNYISFLTIMSKENRQKLVSGNYVLNDEAKPNE